MVDIRQEVVNDRGLIKQLEMVIPGFRGYRKREDLRIADRLLREQMAKRLKDAGSGLEAARRAMSRRQMLESLEEIGRLIGLANSTESRIRHAEQGYTGVSPDFRIEENELNQMYEWDLSMLKWLDEMRNGSERLLAAAESSDMREMGNQLRQFDAAMKNFNQTWDKRRERIAGLEVQ
jgi:hypothetical protein